MSEQLTVGSVVSIRVSDGMTRIGKIECRTIYIILYYLHIHIFFHNVDIGYIDSIDYVGINLVDPVCNGGDGSIGDTQYFNAPLGHGIFIRTSNIIRKVSSAELMMKLQQNSIATQQCQRKIVKCMGALKERDDYIDKLVKEQRRLKALVKAKKAKKSSKKSSKSSNAGRSRSCIDIHIMHIQYMLCKSFFVLYLSALPASIAINETNDTVYNVAVMSPVPKLSKSKSYSLNNENSKNVVNIRKHSEYSKWQNMHTTGMQSHQSVEFVPSETEWCEQEIDYADDHHDTQIPYDCHLHYKSSKSLPLSSPPPQPAVLYNYNQQQQSIQLHPTIIPQQHLHLRPANNSAPYQPSQYIKSKPMIAYSVSAHY